jgi:hypothetical protein
VASGVLPPSLYRENQTKLSMWPTQHMGVIRSSSVLLIITSLLDKPSPESEQQHLPRLLSQNLEIGKI